MCQQEYQPKPYINSAWYQFALKEFSSTEVLEALSLLPNNKACGPSGISYEMLKHAGTLFLDTITALFNHCLTSGQISNQ